MKEILFINFRKSLLKKLLQSIEDNHQQIADALYRDFKKPDFETFVTEIYVVESELKLVIKNLSKWARPQRVFPSLLNFPSIDYIYKEPYGNVLIIAPWNYPFQLALAPLIAAISAGNTATLKPSELTPHTTALLKKIISEVFPNTIVQVEEGDAQVAQKLLEKRWDYIFFTGSVAVGKIVAQAAAQHLTPTTLELGGKNPCIVDATASIQLAAKRIVWGKFINAGQTCIAPDYILVHKDVKEKLIAEIICEIELAYSKNQKTSEDFPRIINAKNFDRLYSLIENEKILYGGIFNKENLYVSPTLIDEPKLQSAIMQEEIFGPLLPILSYSNESEIEKIITSFEKPLALYIFSNNKKNAQNAITKYSFGGGCINDTVIHFSNKKLPFGGVGHSGIGSYHGKYGFDTFSHKKAIVKKAIWLDLPLRYAPYKNKLKLIKKVLYWL